MLSFEVMPVASQSKPSSYTETITNDKRCVVERTASIISNKWTTLILKELLIGTKRFGELKKTLKGISPKTLTQRLKLLENEGIIVRTVYPEVPPRVEYQLTEKGQELRPVIDAMAIWGQNWT